MSPPLLSIDPNAQAPEGSLREQLEVLNIKRRRAGARTMYGLVMTSSPAYQEKTARFLTQYSNEKDGVPVRYLYCLNLIADRLPESCQSLDDVANRAQDECLRILGSLPLDAATGYPKIIRRFFTEVFGVALTQIKRNPNLLDCITSFSSHYPEIEERYADWEKNSPAANNWKTPQSTGRLLKQFTPDYAAGRTPDQKALIETYVAVVQTGTVLERKNISSFFQSVFNITEGGLNAAYEAAKAKACGQFTFIVPELSANPPDNKPILDYPTEAAWGKNRRAPVFFSQISLNAQDHPIDENGPFVVSYTHANIFAHFLEWVEKRWKNNLSEEIRKPHLSLFHRSFGYIGGPTWTCLIQMGVLTSHKEQGADIPFSRQFQFVYNDRKQREKLLDWAKSFRDYRRYVAQQYQIQNPGWSVGIPKTVPTARATASRGFPPPRLEKM